MTPTRARVTVGGILSVLVITSCANVEGVIQDTRDAIGRSLENRDTEETVIADLKCAENYGKLGRPQCYKWISDAQSSQELTDQLSKTIALLHNIAILDITDERRRGKVSQSTYQTLFREEVWPVPSWNTTLDNLGCQLNGSQSLALQTSYCRRPWSDNYVSDFGDLTNHISGVEILPNEALRWQRSSRERLLVVPDLNTFVEPTSIEIVSTDEISFRQMVLSDPAYCDGLKHSLIRRGQLTEQSELSDEDCVQFYLISNGKENSDPDATVWEEGVLIFPQVSIIFRDKVNRVERARLPGKYRSFLRAIDVDIADFAAQLDGDLFSYDYDRAGFEPGTNIVSENDDHKQFSKPTSSRSVTEENAFQRGTQDCLTAFGATNLDEHEFLFRTAQSRLFEEINHFAARDGDDVSNQILSRLKSAFNDGVGSVGIIDTNPSEIKHCENPIKSEGKCDSEEEDIEPTSNHGLTVSAVATAAIHRRGHNGNQGMVGVFPCAHTEFVEVNWATIKDTEIAAAIQDSRLSSTAKIWNISASRPSKGDDYTRTIFQRLREEMRLSLHVLYVVASGRIDVPKGFQSSSLRPLADCDLFPACFSDKLVSKRPNTESPNILSVIGVEKKNGVIQPWVSRAENVNVASATSKQFDIAAFASGVDETPLFSATIDSNNEAILAPVEGVSLAVPQVAATALMLKELHPTLSPQQIKGRIMACGRWSPELDAHVETGLLDIECTLDTNKDRLTVMHPSELDHGQGRTEVLRGVVFGIYRDATGERVENKQMTQFAASFSDFSDRETYHKNLLSFNSRRTPNSKRSTTSIRIIEKLDGELVRRNINRIPIEAYNVEFLVDGEPQTRCIPVGRVASLVLALDSEDPGAQLNETGRMNAISDFDDDSIPDSRCELGEQRG
jgi:hypothetical protein